MVSILPILNFTGICTKIVAPLSTGCETVTDSVHSFATPLFLTAFTAIGTVVILRVAICVAENRNKKMFRTASKELRDYAVNESLLGNQRPISKTVKKLHVADNIVSTVGIIYSCAVIGVIFFFLDMNVDKGCKGLKVAAVDFCDNGINSIIDSIINGKANVTAALT